MKGTGPAPGGVRRRRGATAIRGTVVRIEGRYPFNVPIFFFEEIDILERKSGSLVTLHVEPTASIGRQITLGSEINCHVEPGRLVRVE